MRMIKPLILLQCYLFTQHCAAAAPTAPEELYDFGKILSTGICKMAGRHPIVSFPKWGKEMAPDQLKLTLVIIHPRLGAMHFQGLSGIEEVEKDKRDPTQHLVNVQSMYCPPHDWGTIWMLDSGHGPTDDTAPLGATKLLRVRLDDNGGGGAIERIYTFPEEIVSNKSYLSDVRVDKSGFAYITDSNLGKIIVLNLESATVLAWSDERMQSTLKDEDKFEIDGVDVPLRTGTNVDSIAYSGIDDMLFFKPMTRNNLYRVSCKVLRDSHRQGVIEDLGALGHIEDLGSFGFHDGLEADEQGNLYMTDLGKGAIQKRAVDGKTSWISEPGLMPWPGAVTVSENNVFVLTTQIHLMPFLHEGKDMRVKDDDKVSGNKLLRINLDTSKADL